MAKLWFGTSGRPYPEDEPPFFEPHNYSWTIPFEEKWPVIKEEVTKFLNEKNQEFEKGSFLYNELAPKGGWSSVKFLYWGMLFSDDIKKCPVLNEFLNQVPGLVSSGFSRLKANSIIAPHYGDTNGTFRCHFGIDVPAGLPDCGIKAGDQEKAWENGKWLFFNDAHKHSTWNNTDKDRVVMIIDVIRPEFIHRKRWICGFILARHVSFFYDQYKPIKNLPSFIKTILFATALVGIFIYVPFYNFLKKLKRH